MCTVKVNTPPCEVYKLVKCEQEWTHSSIEVKGKDGDATKFLNSVIMADGSILVVLGLNYAILSKELVKVSDIDNDTLNPCV